MAGHQLSLKRLLGFLFPVSLIVLAGFIFLNRHMLHDQLVLASYNPPPQIAALAEGADLSEEGKQRFYVAKPELHGKKTFSNVCQDVGDEQSNVLGCFTGTRIYVYDVPAGGRLAGVEEVTAAHEMLHVAYARLDQSEKARVNKLIERQLQQNITPHVEELIDVYQRLEPNQLLNEMHSILATEQRQLVPELEQYLGQYFNDRQTVVSLATSYRGVFESLRQEQKQLAAELDSLAVQIDEQTAALNTRIAEYNAAVEAFNRRARSGEMAMSEFDRQKAQLDNERAAIEQAIAENNASRDQYERKRQAYEALALQFTQLQNKINSKPAAPKGI